MKNKLLLNKILSINGFVEETVVTVDGETVYIRPLYIEKISLYPDIQAELAGVLSEQIKKFDPQVLYAIEASILPLATLIAQNLNIPLSIVRKPRNFKHENNEPNIFIEEEMKCRPSVLLDDAIWSGYTMRYILEQFEALSIQLPKCYFIFDFSTFCNGCCKLLPEQKTFLQANSVSWVSYREVIDLIYERGLISEFSYRETLKLFLLEK